MGRKSRRRGNKEELLRKPVSQQIQSNLAAQVGDQWIKDAVENDGCLSD